MRVVLDTNVIISGLNFPGTQVFSVSVHYLFGAY